LAEIKWIKLTVDMFDNKKIKHLRRLPEGNNIVLIWVMLLTMAGKCNANGLIYLTENIPYTTKMLADELDFEENTVKLALEALARFDMIVMDGDYLTISGWQKHQNIEGMDKIREQNRIRKQNQRAKQKLALSRDSHGTVTQSHATDKDIDKEKEEDIDNTILPSGEKPSKLTKAEIDEFFEYIWSKYPVKKGKGQVSDSKKKELFGIGAEELERAIKRYLTDLKKEEWRKPQNGSTFFNSGYVDYLDSNYEPPVPTDEPQPVKDRPLSDYDRFMGELKAMYNESEE